MANYLEEFGLDRLKNQQDPNSGPRNLDYGLSPSTNQASPPPMNDLDIGMYGIAATMGLDPMNKNQMQNQLQALIQGKQQQQAMQQQVTQAPPPKPAAAKPTEPTSKKKGGKEETNVEELLGRQGQKMGEEYWNNYYDNLGTIGFGGNPQGKEPVQTWIANSNFENIQGELSTRYGDAVKLKGLVGSPDRQVMTVEVDDVPTFLLASQEKLDSGETLLPKTNTIFSIKSDPEGFAEISSAYPEYTFARAKTDEEQDYLEKQKKVESMVKQMEVKDDKMLEVFKKYGQANEIQARQWMANGPGKNLDRAAATIDQEIIGFQTALLKNKRQYQQLYSNDEYKRADIDRISKNMQKEDSTNKRLLKEKEDELADIKWAKGAMPKNGEWNNEIALEYKDTKNSIVKNIVGQKGTLVKNGYLTPEPQLRKQVVPYNNSITTVGKIIADDSQNEIYKAKVKDLKTQLSISDDDSTQSIMLKGYLGMNNALPLDREEAINALNATLWTGKTLKADFLNETAAFLSSADRGKLAELQKMVDNGVGMTPRIETVKTKDGGVKDIEQPSLFESSLNEIVSVLDPESQEAAKKNILFAMSPQAAPILASWKFNEMSAEQKAAKVKQAVDAGQGAMAMEQILNLEALNKFYGWSDTNNSILKKLKSYINSNIK